MADPMFDLLAEFWPFILVTIAALLFIILAYYLRSKNILEKFNMSTYGPFVMWKTQRGRALLERMAKVKWLWTLHANASLVMVIIAMVFMFAMIIMGAFSAYSTQVRPMSIQEILVIPGVNPMIPLWYGLIGLIVAVVVHELSHGILARKGGLGVKSMGILLLIIPVGAFVEPDEADMKKAKRKVRTDVYAAGPGANIVVGMLCALIFSWVFIGSVAPIEDGMLLTGVYKDSPSADAGITPAMEIIEINGTTIGSVDDILEYRGAMPNETIPIKVMYEGKARNYTVRSGLFITYVQTDSGADKAGLEPGMMIESINSTYVLCYDDFTHIMENTTAGQVINGTFIERVVAQGEQANESNVHYNRIFIENIVLTDKYDEYKDMVAISDSAKEQIDGFKGKGFLGVGTAYLGVTGVMAGVFMESLHRPVTSADSVSEALVNVISYGVLLPLEREFIPLQSPVSDVYEVHGPLSVLPTPVFWFLANLFYYMFWLNILLGTFNALPAFPLDGGFIFRDFVDFLFFKFQRNKRRAVLKEGLTPLKWEENKYHKFPLAKYQRRKVVDYVFFAVSIIIGIAILWTVIAPYLARAV